MRRHAPMWEAELGSDSADPIEIYSRKFLDDMEASQQLDTVARPSWLRLLTFLAAAAIFLFVGLGLVPSG